MVREKNIENQVAIFNVGCNMSFSDNKYDGRTKVNIDIFLS